MSSSIESRLNALLTTPGSNFPSVVGRPTLAQLASGQKPKQQQQQPPQKRPRSALEAATSSGVSAPVTVVDAALKEENKHLKEMIVVLKDAVHKERTKNESLKDEVRRYRTQTQQNIQNTSLLSKEVEALRHDLVSSKEALAEFAIRAKNDREESVSNAKWEAKNQKKAKTTTTTKKASDVNSVISALSLFDDEEDGDDDWM